MRQTVAPLTAAVLQRRPLRRLVALHCATWTSDLP
jgi:hypothetical protein